MKKKNEKLFYKLNSSKNKKLDFRLIIKYVEKKFLSFYLIIFLEFPFTSKL
jgi:hypothetical protein